MILLSGHSLTPARKVPLEALSLQLKERESTASMTPADVTGISVGVWLRDETNPGKDIVWRVKGTAQAFGTGTVTVNLEHAISLLKDVILFGKVGPAQITGNSKATSCTAQQAVSYILRQQSDWTLGTFGFSVSNPYTFDGETLFDALETVTDSLEDAVWTYDMTRYPFRLNIIPAPAGVDSEMRAGRNLRTISRTIDKSGMYTRLYPIGANDLHIDGNYVEKNTSQYGIVSKTETENSISNKAELKRWAQERLKKHCEPTVSIDIDGFELADATGESMDRLTLGRICRVPLPEYGNVTIQERIVSMSYPDKVHTPETVKITLANNRNDITRIVSDAIKKSGRSGRASVKRDKEDMAWFEDTNDHVAMCAKGIVGVDAQGNPNWTRLSQIYVDGNGIDMTVKTMQGDIAEAESRISQTENAITAEVKRAKNEEKELSGRIKVEAGKVSLVVEEKDGKNVLKTASIVTAINDSGSSIRLDADKVYIGNQKSTTVIAGKISMNDLTVDILNSKISQIGTLSTIAISASGNIWSQGAIMGAGVFIGRGAPYKNVADAVDHLTLTPVVGQEAYELTEYYLNGTSKVVGTFDHAAPTTLAGSWDGNTYTVTASPQNITEDITLQARPSIESGAYTDVYVSEPVGSGVWRDHGTPTRLTMSSAVSGLGQLVSLKGDNGITYAKLQVNDPAVSSGIRWDGRNVIATASTRGAERSTTPRTIYVNAENSHGNDYTDVYVAENLGSGFINHGDPTKLTLTAKGRTVSLVNPQKSVLALKAVSDASITITSDYTGTNPQSTTNNNKITAVAKIGRYVVGEAKKTIHIREYGWSESSARKAIDVRLDNANGALVDRLWLTMPTIDESCTNPAAYAFQITAKCGVRTVKYTLQVSDNGGIKSWQKS